MRNRSNRIGHWLVLSIALLLGMSRVQGLRGGQSNPAAARTLYQQALHEEDATGNLNAAIALYQRVLAAKPERTLAAQALIHMGDCYQKLGNNESRKIYERVVREYMDQTEAVAAARAKLGSEPAETNVVAYRRVWTASTRFDFYGKVSPDGRYIPYTNWSENGDLFVHDVSTGADRRLTNTASDIPGGSGEFGEEIAFSRDARQAAYTWSLGKNGGVELRLIALQGTTIPSPRVLVRNGDLKWIYPYDWSPDGKYIATFIHRNDRTAQIALASVKDGSIRVLKSVDWRGPNGIFFSPDGKYVAYDLPEDSAGNRDVFVLAVDGSGEVPAVVSPGNDAIVGWAPDGKHLLFASDRSGSTDLWAIGFSDGRMQGPAQLLRKSIGQSLGMTSQGAQYSVNYNPGGVGPDIQVADFDVAEAVLRSKPIPVTLSFMGTNVYPVWSPGGENLAYASIRDSHVVIGIRSVRTGQIREVIPTPNFTPSIGAFWSLGWAPDGKSFIVTGNGTKHGNGVFRIDSQTGETSLIAQAVAPRVAVLSLDGNTLYFRNADRQDNPIFIVKRDLASGEEKELIRSKYMTGANLSPDGRYFGVVTASERSGPFNMVLIPTNGEKPREAITRPSLGGINFSPDGRYIATSIADDATKTVGIFLISVEGEDVHELMRKSSDGRIVGVAAWMPDSRSVLVKSTSQNSGQSEVWRVPIDGAQPKALDMKADRLPGRFIMSSDGQHIALQSPQSEKKPAEIWVTENLIAPLRAGK